MAAGGGHAPCHEGIRFRGIAGRAPDDWRRQGSRQGRRDRGAAMSTVMNEATSVAHGVKASARAMPADALPLRPVGGGFTLLEGVRVIDLTTSVAGPSATMLLADMGAEVLKIERPAGGDDARAWGPPFLDGESLWFMSVNRNKKSVALDYSRPEGLDVLHRLVRLADVVVVNLPPR